MGNIAYRGMIFFLALNLGFYLVGNAEILTVSQSIYTINETQYMEVFNATEMVDTYAESQDPTSDIAGTKYALTFFWNAISGMLFGFPNFLNTIEWLPSYVSTAIYVMWLFMLSAWVVGFIRGRGVDE